MPTGFISAGRIIIKATVPIDDMIAFIQAAKRVLAYQAGNDVYFDTNAFELWEAVRTELKIWKVVPG